MFLPGVSLKVKLLGIVVLAILTVSLVGTGLAAVNQALAEGKNQAPFFREESASFADTQGRDSVDHAVVSGLKFVCPFH